ncbi:hypothetical protein Tco_0046965, partial [Tanacetum coccineum]
MRMSFQRQHFERDTNILSLRLCLLSLRVHEDAIPKTAFHGLNEPGLQTVLSVGVTEEGETVVGDALSRKERLKSRQVRGIILAAQSEAFKQENVLAGRLHGLDQQMERKRRQEFVLYGSNLGSIGG